VFIVKPPKYMLRTQWKWYVLITWNMQRPASTLCQWCMSCETVKVNQKVKCICL